MKSIFLILSALPLFLFGQTSGKILPEKDGLIIFEQSFSIDPIRSDSLFLIARSWVINELKSDRERMLADEMLKDNIIGDGYFPISKKELVSFSYVINLRDSLFECKVFNLAYLNRDDQPAKNEDQQVYDYAELTYKDIQKASRRTKLRTKRRIEDLMLALKRVIGGKEES